jgi:hypothetical protein
MNEQRRVPIPAKRAGPPVSAFRRLVEQQLAGLKVNLGSDA